MHIRKISQNLRTAKREKESAGDNKYMRGKYMNVLVYLNQKTQKIVEKSGIGRASSHQMKALALNGASVVSSIESADIVHINTVFLNSFLMGIRARRAGITLVYHAHSTMEDFRNSYIGANLISGLFKCWLKICYSLGDVIITPTEYSKRVLEGYGIKKKIFAVSNGIDIDEYRRSDERGTRFRQKYGFADSDKVIMSAGLIIKRKGIEDFVELARRMPEYKFIWFGTANMRLVGRAVRAAVKNKPSNLIFAGYVDKQHLQDALCGANLFLFPSHEETEGIVVLEALAMKTPVLLRDIPVYNGWIKNGENAYTAKNLDELEERTRDIIDKKLPDLTERGYEVAMSKSLDKTGAKLLAAYKEAVAACAQNSSRSRKRQNLTV